MVAAQSKPSESEPSVDVVLLRYVEYRRAQVQAEIDALVVGPFSTGNVNRAEHFRALAVVLTEFENLAAWLASGQPSAKAVLTEEQLEHYRWAVSQGFDVPDEIRSRLGL